MNKYMSHTIFSIHICCIFYLLSVYTPECTGRNITLEMIPRSVTYLLIGLLIATGSSASPESKVRKVLALFETVAYSSSYSLYLERIKAQGYQIERRSASDPSLHLREWDTWKYDKLIIFASGIKGRACLSSHAASGVQSLNVVISTAN